jgi:N-carbamoylputrescine amidase
VEAAQLDAWETIQRAHAIANGVFVAAVNRVGREPPMGSSGSTGAGAASGGEGGIRFWGRSFVADPFGRVLARASDRDEELVVVECDLSAVEKVRRDWPFLRDRRIDAYADLLRRFRD